MIRQKADIGKWETWFAWHPVRLLGSSRFVWLRWVSRRRVLTERNTLKRDYSDAPGDHPLGYGLRKQDINAATPPAVNEARRDYRGHDLELKSMVVGWQITITKNGAFIRHSSVSKDLDEVTAEARAFIDALHDRLQDSDD